MFKFSWIFEPKFRWVLDRFLDSKRKHRFYKNSAPACTGARFLRFLGIWNQQKINKTSMQNKNEKMIHVFTSWLSKTWKVAKNMLKDDRKSKLHFKYEFERFLLPFWLSKPFQKTEPPRHFFDIFPKTRPRYPQDAPRRLQDTSKTPLRPSKKPPRQL